MVETKIIVTMSIMEITQAKAGEIQQATITDLPIDHSAISMTEDIVIKVNMNKETPQISYIVCVSLAVC